MARITVERSAIADFLDDLPGLLMQYKQMQWAQEERALEREDRKAATAQQILIKEYYDKKAEVRTTEKVFDQYDNLNPSDVSSSGAGAELISIVDKQNNIDMDAITQNLNALGSYQSELESSLGELRGQAQTLQEIQLDYAGPEGVLEQDEYEEFREHALTAMDEGGLGWTTTAGADVAFYDTDVTTRQIAARNQAKDMKGDLEGDAAGQYEILRGVFTATEDYDADDMIDALTYEDAAGNEIEPSEEVIGAIQRLASQSLTYDNFMDNLAAFPSEGGGDYIRAELMANPQINLVYNDLQKNYKAINVLDNKLAGINDTSVETNLNIFVDEISDVTNEKVLFGLYDEAVKGQNIDFENDPYFAAVEGQLGVIDASDAYLKHKGLASGGIDNALNQLAMTSMTGEELFPGQLETQYRSMEYETAYTYPELSEGITKEEHIRHQMKSVIGAQVGLDIEMFGNESKIVDTKLDKDGRIMVKVDPDADALIGAHPSRWKYKGKPIYLDELNIVSLGRAKEAMPTAFQAGPIGYYWDPMAEEYRIKRNQ